MHWRPLVAATIVAMPMAAGSAAHAQTAAPADLSPWSVDFAIGWDNSISGNINSSGIGQLNNQAAVILKNSYDAVYGTGLHFKFGGGYMVDEVSEIRVGFTFQSLDADLTPMGDSASPGCTGNTTTTRASGSTPGFGATWT